MKNKKIIGLGIACSLVMTVFFSGCGNASGEVQETVNTLQETEAVEDVEVNASESGGIRTEISPEENVLAQEIMKKYSAGAGEYDGKVFKVDRTESIILELGYNPWSVDVDI